MKTVTIEIKIPDGHEVVSVSRRKQYVENDESGAIPYTVHVRPSKPFLINGKPADWPEWLTCDWVAKDEDGEVWAYHSEPEKTEIGWLFDYERRCLFGVNAIDIPGDWTQSKRENPNRKNKKVSE